MQRGVYVGTRLFLEKCDTLLSLIGHTDNQPGELIILCADVGGTNIRLRLNEVFREEGVVKHARLCEQVTKTLDCARLEDAFIGFLKTAPRRVRVGAVALAGPIKDGAILMSNAQKWGLLQEEEFAKKIGLERVKFLNDFEAISYGVEKLEPEDVHSVNGLPPTDDVKAVLGPGTGLGCSILISEHSTSGMRSRVLPCEFGHVDPLLSSSEDLEIMKFIEQESGQAVVLERSFCGPAIPYIFKFYPKSPEAQEQSYEIISKGVAKQDEACERAVAFIWEVYMRVIITFTMLLLPKGGIYLVGSLTNSLIPYIKEHVDQLKARMLWLPDLGLKGARVIAQRIVEEMQVL
ncbi:glucokinase-like [Hippocampus zosterae]|uniref:glucokinase-like n=1 Tax=Hippocampus zosterae TaxID=109293 RepID=UPI00223DB731|nr:glucokinase-like [Hippocampus zosterae]